MIGVIITNNYFLTEDELNVHPNFSFLYNNNPKDIHEFYDILYKYFDNIEARKKKVRKTNTGDGHIFSYWFELAHDTFDPLQIVTFKLNKIDTPGDEVIFINVAIYRFSHKENKNKIRKYPNVWKAAIRPGKRCNWNIKERIIIKRRNLKRNPKTNTFIKTKRGYQNRYITEYNNHKLHPETISNTTIKILRKYLLSVHNDVPLSHVLFSHRIKQNLGSKLSNKIYQKKGISLLDIFNSKYNTAIVNKKLMYEILYHGGPSSVFLRNKEMLQLLDKSQQDMLLYNIQNYDNIFRFDIDEKFYANDSNPRRLIKDTIQMLVDKYRFPQEKVNLHLKISSYKKLKDLHDQLAIENRIRYSSDKIHKENIDPLFFKLEEYLQKELESTVNVELITDTERLIVEGVNQRNCVASYIRDINNGSCTIFSFLYKKKRFTAEMSIERYPRNKATVVLRQLKGFANDSTATEEDLKIKESLKMQLETLFK